MTTPAVGGQMVVRWRLVWALVAGAAVAVGLGVYGNVHDATGDSLITLVFTATINLKVWFATAAVALAAFQLGSALRIYERIGGPRPCPGWLKAGHRVSGTLAFLFSLPVAYHCLWGLGLEADTPRILLHSLFGCVFYGAFATKVIVVRSRGLPDWALPVAGGLVFTSLVVVWWSSSLWFFTNVAFPGI